MRSPRTGIWRSFGVGRKRRLWKLECRTKFTRKPLWFTLVAGRLRDFTDVVYLQRIHRDLFGAIVDQVKFSAFVQGTSKLSFPLCRIRFVYSFLELPSLHSPCLGVDSNRTRVAYDWRCTEISSSHEIPIQKSILDMMRAPRPIPAW